MQLYSCKVRLKGDLLNEVVKSEVTVPEIIVLRHVHRGNNEAVVDIKPLGREAYDHSGFDENEKPIGKVLRLDDAERARLKRLYDPRDKFITPKLFFNGPLPQVTEGIPGAAEPARRRKPVDDTTEQLTA